MATCAASGKDWNSQPQDDSDPHFCLKCLASLFTFVLGACIVNSLVVDYFRVRGEGRREEQEEEHEREIPDYK